MTKISIQLTGLKDVFLKSDMTSISSIKRSHERDKTVTDAQTLKGFKKIAERIEKFFKQAMVKIC